MVGASVRTLRRAQRRWHSTAAALTAYFILLPIHSLKGWPLDWEPANVYFWMFGAMIIVLPRLAQERRPAVRSIALRELWLMQRQVRRGAAPAPGVGEPAPPGVTRLG
jgi:hypothetical protein